nr:GntR family transcriptional regulator [Kibdelosporangium phytohabitans]
MVDALREQIESGAWPVGTWIPPEHDLVKQIGVGRTTVRETLGALVHVGLHRRRPGPSSEPSRRGRGRAGRGRQRDREAHRNRNGTAEVTLSKPPDIHIDPGLAVTTGKPVMAAMAAGLLIAILLVAANLRATLTSVGTLLPSIERDTGLTASAGGVLNTLPLLMFAVTSPFVGRISHRVGTTRLFVAALAFLTVALWSRSLPSIACLFLGTVILSAAIAVGNVLLPTVIRTPVPGPQGHTVSALCVTVMGLVAALSSGISVPLAKALPGSRHSALAGSGHSPRGARRLAAPAARSCFSCQLSQSWRARSSGRGQRRTSRTGPEFPKPARPEPQ